MNLRERWAHRFHPVWTVNMRHRKTIRRLSRQLSAADFRAQVMHGTNRDLWRMLDDAKLEIDLLASASDPQIVAELRETLEGLRQLRTVDPGPRSAP